MKVAVTGANGFIGARLSACLMSSGHEVVRIVRQAMCADDIVVGDIGPSTVWPTGLYGSNCVIHCGARVHVMHETSADALAEFRRVNVDGTLHLARQAALAGVRRFVFLSSVKVNGEATVIGHPFSEACPPSPLDPYGVSKFEAEEGLLALGQSTGMEVVIIRPPLVYGPGVKANFASMMEALYRGFPLPFSAVDQNRRSFVALDNIVDFIVRCIDHPAAAGQVFLVSDGEDLSTADLLARMGRALGRQARLVTVPVGVMRSVAGWLGMEDMASRLLGSLQVDSSKAGELLGWRPVVSVDEALQKTADAFLASKGV